MAVRTETVATGFIAEVRRLHAEVSDVAERWQQIASLLPGLLADPRLKEQSADWPACGQGSASERAENLLFYEDPDYGFVINGLIKAPNKRTQIHDHAHLWTAYGVLDGSEMIERYDRIDDGSKPDYAEIVQTENYKVGAGAVDLVPPYRIHAEQSGEERTVAVIVRSGRPGEFLQGRYDPERKVTWEGYGPIMLPWELR